MEEAWNETLRTTAELFNCLKWESIDKELLAACDELKSSASGNHAEMEVSRTDEGSLGRRLLQSSIERIVCIRTVLPSKLMQHCPYLQAHRRKSALQSLAFPLCPHSSHEHPQNLASRLRRQAQTMPSFCSNNIENKKL